MLEVLEERGVELLALVQHLRQRLSRRFRHSTPSWVRLRARAATLASSALGCVRRLHAVGGGGVELSAEELDPPMEHREPQRLLRTLALSQLRLLDDQPAEGAPQLVARASEGLVARVVRAEDGAEALLRRVRLLQQRATGVRHDQRSGRQHARRSLLFGTYWSHDRE